MKTLLISYDLQPPWDNGLKVYSRGLKRSLESIVDMELTTAVNSRDITSSDLNAYDFVHVVQTGIQPFSNALKLAKNATIFKHIVTPSMGLKNSFTTKLCYAAFNSWEKRLKQCFSSSYVAKSYFMDDSLIIPPSIDTSTFLKNNSSDQNEVMSFLRTTQTTFGIENIAGRTDGLILYSGPLTPDRFPYAKVLNALKQTSANILIVGRTTNNGAEQSMMEEIINHAKKLDLTDRISIALKVLTEEEKVSLLNFADMIIQPFANNTHVYVAVDPPIFLLEAMACGKPVITSRSYSFESLMKNGHNGYAVSWDDASAVSEAIVACNDPRIGINARQTVLEQFSTQQVSGKIQRMYNDFN